MRYVVFATFLAFAVVPNSTATAADETADVVVQVRAIDGEGGTIRCKLYTSDNWLDSDQALRSVDAASRDGSTATCRFEEVPPGVYGVGSYHDRDDDGEMDSNVIGIPSEPVCVSKGPPDGWGKPSFEGAKFEHGESGTSVDCPFS